ncbi:hypothetical protein HY546_01465 [archaeon]|nr:hypothetical protein [archaeon]
MKTIRAIQLVLRSRKHLYLAIASALTMLFFSFYIPSLITPYNTISYQLSVLTTLDAFLLLSFSVLFGLSIAVQVYAFQLARKHRAAPVCCSAASCFAAMIGSMFAGPLCASCIAAIFAILGVGGSATLFVSSYGSWVVLVSFVSILLFLLLAARKIARIALGEAR